jgi:hypothetical protein
MAAKVAPILRRGLFSIQPGTFTEQQCWVAARTTVFELAALGNSSYEYTVLWTFNGKDGTNPYSSLILDSAGNLYGTAAEGGLYGYGVAFEVSGVRAATATTLTSSPNPSTYGQPVTFTAVVIPAARWRNHHV